MKQLFLFSAFVIVLSAVVLSCKKGDVGPAGPTGATGPAGAAGSNGTNGANGAKGDTGKANIIYSDWITKTLTDWAGIGTSIITSNITAAGITADIKDRGIILVYQDFAGSVKLLPYAYSSTGDHFDFTFAIGLISLRDYHQDGSNIAGFPDTKYRYVLVPGSISSGRIMNGATANLSTAQLKTMSYAELVTLFNIPASGTNSK